MSRTFKDVEYTKVDLDSPRRDAVAGPLSASASSSRQQQQQPAPMPDNSVGLAEGELDPDGEEEEAEANTGDGAESRPAGESKKPGVLSMAYYQRYFNVDTRQVGARLLGSFVPRPGKNFVSDEIRHSPDLYGPFWICTTLIFTTAVAGNLADYFQASSAGLSYVWVYDFKKVTFAATAIYLYWWLVPLLLWGIIWWRQLPEKYTFLELLCLYGYSLAVYIPVSVLCVIQFAWLQWLLILLALAASGAVLCLSLWPCASSGERRSAVAILTVAAVLHAALAVGFKLYFFRISVGAGEISVPSVGSTVTTTPAVAGSSTKGN